MRAIRKHKMAVYEEYPMIMRNQRKILVPFFGGFWFYSEISQSRRLIDFIPSYEESIPVFRERTIFS